MAAEPNDDERARALAEVERDYPGWHAWPGVLAGVVYARRPRSSPPLVRPLFRAVANSLFIPNWQSDSAGNICRRQSVAR